MEDWESDVGLNLDVWGMKLCFIFGGSEVMLKNWYDLKVDCGNCEMFCGDDWLFMGIIWYVVFLVCGVCFLRDGILWVVVDGGFWGSGWVIG